MDDTLIVLLAVAVVLMGATGIALIISTVLSVVAPQGWVWRELPARRKILGAGIALLCSSMGLFSIVQWVIF